MPKIEPHFVAEWSDWGPPSIKWIRRAFERAERIKGVRFGPIRRDREEEALMKARGAPKHCPENAKPYVYRAEVIEKKETA